jgi:ATP-dependent DNA helicase RecQ
MHRNIYEILQNYWGFSRFRPLQEEIINSVLAGNDTLALLPTGGGKSITFQVPALAFDGITIVISPLIALMVDQVENLLKRNIPAAAIHSGLTQREIDVILHRCIYSNDIKLLYISPERLQTLSFREKLSKMKVSFVAVDEAHCISQWGYDFRPPYLNIASIRDIFPDISFLAVTATATPRVVDDIVEKLHLKNVHIFKQSFYRENLIYNVIETEDKMGKLLRLLKQFTGSTIIYVRNRKKTVTIAKHLHSLGFSAIYYHAGLSADEREARQKAWINNQYRIMVATNAFGMGIDKPDVRLVVHLDLPDSIESYFQEAGRAGRDLKLSYAFLFFHSSDIDDFKNNIIKSFPDIKIIKQTYKIISQFYNLNIGEGENEVFSFSINDIISNNDISPIDFYNSLLILEKAGYISLSEGIKSKSRLFFLKDKNEIYKIQLEYPEWNEFIKILTRTYSGLFTEYCNISESNIAQKTNLSIEQVSKLLLILKEQGILDYIPTKGENTITFLKPCIDPDNIEIPDFIYETRKKINLSNADALISYITNQTKCRSQLLLEYFGEESIIRCGRCDVCVSRNKVDLSKLEMDNIINLIKPLLREKPMTESEILEQFSIMDEIKVIRVISWLMETNKIIRLSDMRLSWKK